MKSSAFVCFCKTCRLWHNTSDVVSFVIALKPMLHRRFVIQVHLSTPRIAFISIDLQPNGLNKWVYFRHESVGAYMSPCTHCVAIWTPSPQQGDQGPKNITQHQCFWCIIAAKLYCGVACLLLRMDANSCC